MSMEYDTKPSNLVQSLQSGSLFRLRVYPKPANCVQTATNRVRLIRNDGVGGSIPSCGTIPLQKGAPFTPGVPEILPP